VREKIPRLYPGCPAEFNYFLSCGIPNKVRGERYVQTPEMVQEIFDNTRPSPPRPNISFFKRWDKLDEKDNPQVVIFFAIPDVLSGLFTLARFDETDRGRNPGSIRLRLRGDCAEPLSGAAFRNPHSILGMFDPSARVSVPKDMLTLAVPMKNFVKMIDNMEESFLITEAWQKVQKRIR